MPILTLKNNSRILFVAIAALFFALLMGDACMTGQAEAQSVFEKTRKSNSPVETKKPSEPVELTNFHVVGTDDTVRIVLDVSADVNVASSLVTSPYRIVIDLPHTVLKLKAHRSNGSPGFLKKVSFGTVDDTVLRFVIETGVPVHIEKQFGVPAANGGGRRLVFDLLKTSESEFHLARERKEEEERLQREKVAKELAALKLKSERDRQSTSSKRAAKEDIAKPKRKKRIVIDPGHGGKDGGAKTLSGVLEKEIVLSFSKKLARLLSASGDFEVSLTRTTDRFIRLSERVRIARARQADLFVSIHADSLPEDRRVRGTAVYTLSERASDAMAARIAAQQNKSDAIAGHEIINGPDAVVDILFDLTRRETSNLSIVFARHFFENMRSEIRFFKEPLQRGAFTVLRVPDIPSALIELGFLSNAQDARLLSSEAWREETAQHMAKTIAAYFDKPVIGLHE